MSLVFACQWTSIIIVIIIIIILIIIITVIIIIIIIINTWQWLHAVVNMPLIFYFRVFCKTFCYCKYMKHNL